MYLFLACRLPHARFIVFTYNAWSFRNISVRATHYFACTVARADLDSVEMVTHKPFRSTCPPAWLLRIFPDQKHIHKLEWTNIHHEHTSWKYIITPSSLDDTLEKLVWRVNYQDTLSRYRRVKARIFYLNSSINHWIMW